MFNYCPSCASAKITFNNGKQFYCPDCGFVYFHNISAATGIVIEAAGSIVFLVRGKEPALGRLDLPGGFVDAGEGALESLLRECREEIGWEPDLSKLALFASFPNVYPYKNIVYNTCDLFFSVQEDRLTEKMLTLQKDEISGVRFIKKDKIDFEEFAFDSTKRAIKTYLEKT